MLIESDKPARLVPCKLSALFACFLHSGPSGPALAPQCGCDPPRFAKRVRGLPRMPRDMVERAPHMVNPMLLSDRHSVSSLDVATRETVASEAPAARM